MTYREGQKFTIMVIISSINVFSSPDDLHSLLINKELWVIVV